MNISFQALTGQKVEESRDEFWMDPKRALPTDQRTSRSSVQGAGNVNLQLDSSIFSNDAYACHAKSLSDISEMADNTDVLTQHNYMALLSNTMSEEDFAKASKEGFDINNLDSGQTVTILDKIKSVLLESGKEIVGFNDDLSLDKLSKLTGSISFAKELQKSFHENDIPVTYENAKSAAIAYNQISDIQGLEDAAVKYLVHNNMKPSMENIYFAAHSTNGQNRMGRGFYAQDAGGYYAQKAETYDWGQLDGQIDKIIDEAGLRKEDEQVREEARWIIQQGIPLTADTLNGVHRVKEISFPVSESSAAKAIAAAIANGKKAVAADLSDDRNYYRQAVDIKEATEKISEDDIRTNIQAGKENTLRNLIAESELNDNDYARVAECSVDTQDTRFVQARLQLEEVRLRMTVDANKQLLSSGFSIDTAPMEQLIERLKNILGQIPDESAGAALDEIAEVTPANQTYIIRATLSKVAIIQSGPIEISGAQLGEIETASLAKLSDVTMQLKMRYKKAGESYEPMMTAPRADLGDNIKKAFRNVDDILKDMGQEINDSNRRAIRILGYNSMELSIDNFEKVRAFDQSLKTTLDRLKPGAVLDIVREGKNPLGMTVGELAEALDQNLMGNDEPGNGGSRSDEKYAKFLYKLEHKKEITVQERSAFIGIYRLFHTIKKNDYQAIGAVLKTGMEMTLGNLLAATRIQSAYKRGIEYTVDDDFGGVELKNTSGLKIDEQINLAFKYYSAQADIVYENLEPEKLMQAAPSEDTLLPKFAEDLQNAGVEESLERQYASQVIRQIRETAQTRDSDNALEELKGLHMEVNFGNLEAMISNRRERKNGNIWQKAEDLAGERALRETGRLVDALGEPDYVETYKNSLSNISDSLEQLLMSDDDSYIDVKAINLMQRRMTVMSQSSDQGTFDVPVTIDGQKISMHITLKSDNSMDSRMEASVQTYEYGLITASLYVKENMVTGMLTTTYSQSSEEAEYLESVRSKMCVKLAEKLKDIGVGQEQIAILYHAQTQPISVGTANANATDGNQKNKADTTVLLSMAKAFIESL